MAQIDSAFSRDANGVPITTFGLMATKTLAYTGAAGLGAQDATTLFTVTGTVLVRLFAVCTEDLASTTGTVEVGIAGNTAALLAQTTATNIDNGEVWVDNGPATIEALPAAQIIGAGQDIIQTIATANVTDGTLTYYCLWTPVSSDGNVVAV